MKKLLFILFLLIASNIYAQRDLVEIDTITGVANKPVPFDKPFTLKMLVDTESINNIYIIPKYKYFPLDSSIGHQIAKHSAPYRPVQIPKHYYSVKKISDKKYLQLSFEDTFLLKPSTEYFIIIDYNKIGESVNSIIDNYFHYKHETDVTKKTKFFNDAYKALKEYDKVQRDIYGQSLVFGTYPADVSPIASFANFDRDFINSLDTPIAKYYYSVDSNNIKIKADSNLLAKMVFSFDSLSKRLLFRDTSINSDVVHFLDKNDLYYNSLLSNFSYLSTQVSFVHILSGALSLNCINCEKINVASFEVKDLQKRLSNLDSSLNVVNKLREALFLLKPTSTSTSNINITITSLDSFSRVITDAKSRTKGLVSQRKKIESISNDSLYDGFNFHLSTVTQGSSMLDFATRNKALLTPDFGIVTSALFKSGKNFDYGIVPYLGFHINLMPVNKDVTFSTYKKDWKQHLSFMVGWSLVSMEKDSTYKNFFEKSSLLTGLGYRFNNVLRFTAGTEWLFKTGADKNNNPKKKLAAFPYLGFSLDLDIKAYLNGFVDLLSGIGKTKPDATTSFTTSQ